MAKKIALDRRKFLSTAATGAGAGKATFSPLTVDLDPGSDLTALRTTARLDGADPDMVSARALTRGAEQCGTLGSGNHFLEVQIVDHVFDEEAASVMGLIRKDGQHSDDKGEREKQKQSSVVHELPLE